MKCVLAQSAGYCYGVKRAVELAEKTAGEGGCLTLGPLIHNRQEVERLRALGVEPAADTAAIPDGATVLIRSHGVGRREYEALREKGCTIVDATCPNVARIHDIVREASKRGRQPVIIGSAEHPEVLGTAGWCEGALVFRDAEEIERWLNESPERRALPLTFVCQTTESAESIDVCSKLIKKQCTNREFFDTICSATSKRQNEAKRLAGECSAMVVIGGAHSANSRRLAELCGENCGKVLFAESADELDLGQLGVTDTDTVGVTAGASVPAWIIKEVYEKMSDEIRNMENTEPAVEAEIAKAAEEDVAAEGESFKELLEKNFKTLITGEKVTGVVAAIGATEVSVDLGTKQSGYIPISELSSDPDVKPEDIVQIGKEIETYVMRVNDVEGTVMLSKKRLDTVKSWDSIEAARADKTTVEGIVTEENKGGVVVSVKGVRVFVPASQTGLPKNAPMSGLLKTRVKLRITEVNNARRRVVGSIRAVQFDERRAAADKIWEDIEVGKKYHGTVKSITSYGAFVDIGGIDGMVHVSEMSWTRIKNPAEVVSVGDEVDVYVISFDKENRKISLGMKDASNNPWSVFTSKYEIGSTATVKIVKLMPFGAFAEVVPGVDGLIHISQIADRRIGKPDDVLSEGQTVDVRITDIDNDRKKISLSIRALLTGEPAASAVQPEAIEEDVVVYDTDAPKTEE